MILDKLNNIRKRIMPKITGRIGKSHIKKVKKVEKKIPINRILVCRPNQRLGNMLLTTPLLQELVAEFPDCEIDIIVKGGVAFPVFQNYANIGKIIVLPRKPFKELIKYMKVFFSVKNKKYDMAINGEKGSSSGKILTYLANAKYKVYGLEEEGQHKFQGPEYAHLATNIVHYFRDYLRLIGYPLEERTLPNLDLKLEEAEIAEGKQILSRHVPNTNKKTIAIFTYATGEKRYSKEWWAAFYQRLESRFGNDYNLLEILPVENVSQIDFAAPSYYSKDIREIASVMANTEIFIGADSGIMHLASAAKTPTVGLFSVTDPKKYAPYNGKSTAVKTPEVSLEETMEIIGDILGRPRNER